MSCFTIRRFYCWLCLFLTLTSLGCSWFGSTTRQPVPAEERPTLAVLPFGMGIDITRLSDVQSINGENPLPPEEAVLVAQAVQHIRHEARRLLHERLLAGDQFDVMSLDETDVLIAEPSFDFSQPVTEEQFARLRNQLHADLIVGGVVQDYGKVRWQWLAAGMFTDTTAETIALGLATAWNPAALGANLGFNLLTSTPVWFGGGYLFGIALRPVRVEAWAMDHERGEQVWQSTEVALYAKERLKEVPEDQRGKKEAQLHVNLSKAMEALGDSLLDAKLTKTTLKEASGRSFLRRLWDWF